MHADYLIASFYAKATNGVWHFFYNYYFNLQTGESLTVTQEGARCRIDLLGFLISHN